MAEMHKITEVSITRARDSLATVQAFNLAFNNDKSTAITRLRVTMITLGLGIGLSVKKTQLG